MREEVKYKNQYLDCLDQSISLWASSDHPDKEKIIRALNNIKEFYHRWSEDDWEPEYLEKQYE